MSNLNEIKKIIKRLNLVGKNTIDTRVNETFIKSFIENKLSGREAPFLNPIIKYLNKNFYVFNLKDFKFRSFDLEIAYDHHNIYMQNAYGFRSNNFIKNEDLVFSGCSITYGMGIPEQDIWGYKIAKDKNISSANLAVPGDSVQGIVLNLFAYFKKFGNPKNLFCLMPSFDRMKYPMNSDWNKIWGSTLEPWKNALEDQTHWKFKIIDLGKKKKFLKLPADYHKTIPPDLAFSEAISYLHMLESYCISNNINFKWATWDKDVEDLICLINPYECFVPLNLNLINCNHLDDGTMFFNSGTDNKMGKAHPGTHFHLHVYEIFKKYLVQ